MNHSLIHQLKQGVTVLTPTRRLAARLKNEANTVFASADKVWPTPYVFALNDWFHLLWEQFEIEGTVDVQLLNTTQSLLRWEWIITQSEKGKNLLQPHVTAKTVFAAWHTLHQWLTLHLLEEKTDNLDHATFQAWATSYTTWLNENQYIDEAQFPTHLLKCIVKSRNVIERISPRAQLILYGFEEFSPLLQTFFRTLTEMGWDIDQIESLAVEANQCVSIAFVDEQQEWQAAAVWAKQLLSQNRKRIAIVTPHLTDHRNQIEAVLNDCLSPLHVCQPIQEINRYFNISTAIPLMQYPIAYSAFAFLRLGCPSCSLEEYMSAMTSPFSRGSQAETAIRAKHTEDLKRRSPPLWSLEIALHHCLSQTQPQHAFVVWPKILRELLAYFQLLPTYQSYHEWAQHFRALLALIGWPGERRLSSIEHQVVKRIDELFNELGDCDSVLPPCAYTQAVSTLQKLAANIPFQAENKGAPIQILGLLEAAGQHFDYLWVMGLHNDAWPPVARPNPFIPIDYQRQYKMPHASPEREMIYAMKVTKRLKESAKEIIFSYAIQDKEKEREASELIKEVPAASPAEKIAPFRCETVFDAGNPLEYYVDEQGPALTEAENISQSSQRLTLQAACPFKAFAEIRLGAKRLTLQEIWITPSQRGMILHRVLESLWRILKNQKTLLQLNPELLETKLTHLIESSLSQQLSKEMAPLHKEVEMTRLKIILQDYLSLEKKRPPFEVLSTECERHFYWMNMHFTLRFDRIDKNEKGEVILIDYKSGQFNLADFWGEPLQAPQLPFYFLAIQEMHPKAIIVAKLNSEACEWEGICESDMQMDGVKTLDQLNEVDSPLHWRELIPYWSMRLSILLQDFREGKAAVSPLNLTLCQFCQLQPFCRIQEYK